MVQNDSESREAAQAVEAGVMRVGRVLFVWTRIDLERSRYVLASGLAG